MKPLILILLFPFLLQSQIDKTLHFYAGLTIGVGVSQLLYQPFDKPFRTIPISISCAFATGYAKEKYDECGRSGFNKEDMKFTMWGGLCSFPLNCAFIDKRIKKENKKYQYPEPIEL